MKNSQSRTSTEKSNNEKSPNSSIISVDSVFRLHLGRVYYLGARSSQNFCRNSDSFTNSSFMYWAFLALSVAICTLCGRSNLYYALCCTRLSLCPIAYGRPKYTGVDVDLCQHHSRCSKHSISSRMHPSKKHSRIFCKEYSRTRRCSQPLAASLAGVARSPCRQLTVGLARLPAQGG